VSPSSPGTSPADPLTAAFEDQRDRLRGVAYRLLGSHADAEDAVQEAWLRLSRQDAATIDNLAGWLTTVVGRISLDVLRARARHPEASLDDRLPDLVVAADAPAPDDDVALADTVGLALLVVLESLGPTERLAFVLHDLFAVPFDEIAAILGKSTGATKMLASRARAKVRTGRRDLAGPRQREMVQDFLTAARDGDFEALLRLLDPSVRLTAHNAGGVVVVLGATKVAAGARFGASGAGTGMAVLVDGRPGYLAWREDGTPRAVVFFTVTDDRITAITAVSDPGKLAAMTLPSPA
jgi:RNA polymerase sigma factor (sigma-70 family)